MIRKFGGDSENVDVAKVETANTLEVKAARKIELIGWLIEKYLGFG